MTVIGRPSFAHEFPEDPKIEAMLEAFTRGDYAGVRAEAKAIEQSASDESIKRAARSLVERTRADPLAIALLALTALLLAVVGGFWMVHATAPALASPHPPTPSAHDLGYPR
jgi:hypothetical protein